MKMKPIFLLTAAAVLSANVASANPLFDAAELTFGYDSFSADAGDSSGLWTRGDTTVDLMGVETDLALTYGDIGGDEPTTMFSVAPKFEVNNALTAGVFLDYAMSDDRGDLTAMHYGVEGEYDTGTVELSGFLGKGEVESDTIDLDTTVYGVAAAYEVNANIDLGAFYSVEDDDVNDATEIGFSVGYDLTGMAMPAYVSASISQLDNGTDKTDKIGVSLTVPFGKAVNKGVKRAAPHSVMAGTLFASAD